LAWKNCGEEGGKMLGRLKLLTTKGEVVDAILYCHQETTTIAGIPYYLLKLNTPADASGTILYASTGSVARVVWGRFVFPLTGIAKILASTIYATYRAFTGGGTVNAEIDIKVIDNLGDLRTTIATGVSKSANLGTSWATYTGANYSFAEYTVVDQTDYLEIDYIANVTAKKPGSYAYLRIDDNTLALADQTRSQEWSFSLGPTYTLTLNVDKTSGYVGDVFTFTGTLTQNGTPISGATVTLYKDDMALSPSTTTDANGNYAFQWVADTPGNHSFYAEAVW
jgi:hypothetical protein